MPTITLPNNWRPRDYQIPAWSYLEHGGKHAELIWHRRSGKDDISMHHTQCKAIERVGTYWHMLPAANQVRKAIWDAVNPHTGIRRIDEAFPRELRATTRDTDMFIRFKNGSTWQALGSDNFQGAIGSPPVGIVYSEWALANPSARGYLRPIIRENGGWQIFITTPRGRNHAYSTYNAAMENRNSFAQILNVGHTGMLTEQELQEELLEYTSTYGKSFGEALFKQEYWCSFESAILGAFYADEFIAIDSEQRITLVNHDPMYPVETAWDIGYTDDTAIWFFQTIAGEIRVIDFYAASGKDLDHYCSQLLGYKVSIDFIDGKIKVTHKKDEVEEGAEHRRNYQYGRIGLPHDARAKTLASKGKSTQEQVYEVFKRDLEAEVFIIPDLSIEDGIKAVRQILKYCWFDSYRCEDGISALRSYRREWDDKNKCSKKNALHDWASHPADGFRYLAIMAQKKSPIVIPKPEQIKGIESMTFNQLWKVSRSTKRGRI